MRFEHIENGILRIVKLWEPKLKSLSDLIISERVNKQNRTIKQLLGHLVDSASNNHQRMVRLQYVENLIFPDYTQDNDLWIAIQSYQSYNWYELIQLWKSYNIHIVHIIKSVDESKLENFWIDFEGNKVTLTQMIEGYLSHLNLHMGEIQELIDLTNYNN